MKPYSLKNLRLKNRLIIFFLTTITLPLVLFGTLLINKQVNIYYDLSKSHEKFSTLQLSDKIDTKLAQINSAANLFYLDKDLQSFLITYNSSSQKNDLELTYLFDKYNATIENTYFNAIVIANDGRVFGNALFLNKKPRIYVQNFDWYPKIHNSQSNAIWIREKNLDPLFTSSKEPYIYATRQLHNFDDWTPIGTLVIALSELELKKMYSNYVGEHQSIYILDRSGYVVSFSDNLSIGNEPIQDFDRFYHPSDSFTFNHSSSAILSTHNTINRNGWKIVMYSDVNSLLQPFKNIQIFFLISLLIYFFVTIILSIISSNRFLDPIVLMYSAMSKVKNGNLSSRILVNSNDEIGELSSQFNEMLDQIQNLMSKLVSEEKLKHEAEILALQTQINPHFLYNTLASIRYHIYSGDKESADKTVLALIRLLKNILSNSSEFITISEEISLLVDYIEIQKMTFSSSISVEIDIDKSLQNCRIIKLLLQPLVENAIMHGLKPKKSNCTLKISGKTLENRILFSICDDGIGFDTKKLNLKQNTDTMHHSIGINNVLNRIKLTYGSEADMNIESIIGVGTTITLKFPKVEEEYISYEYFNC